jgi:hypothetical protein
MGRKKKGSHFTHKVSVFGDSCQRGRKYEPKAKGLHHHQFPHHHHFQKVFKEVFNWYLILDIFQIGMTTFKIGI